MSSSVKLGFSQRALLIGYIGARARLFNNMLAEFLVQEKPISIRDKGLFFQEKAAVPGAARAKMLIQAALPEYFR
jgi:hypothetical protein